MPIIKTHQSKITEEHSVVENGENVKNVRVAKIFFIDGEFDRCDYAVDGKGDKYTLEDWKFLKEVADFILEIHEENNQ